MLLYVQGIYSAYILRLVPVAVQSKACVSSCFFVGNVGSCPSEDMDVRLLCR